MNKYYVILLVLVLFLGLAFYEMTPQEKTIYVVSMTANEMSGALKNGTIDGFISWEPFPTKAAFDGYGKSLINSKDAWENHPSCSLALSEDIKDENTKIAIVWALVKGTRFINDPANREKVLGYGGEFSGLDRELVSLAINNTQYVEFPDIDQTKEGLKILYEAGALKNSMDSIGYKDVDDFLENFFIDKYYTEVRQRLDENPDWTPAAVNESIRFGYIDGNIHYLAIYVAQKEGYFEKTGLVPGKNIQFTGYRNGKAILDAFKHREVDAAELCTTVILKFKIDDNGRVAVISGVNTGGSSLVVRADSGIMTLGDLN
ncbi:MAG: ABC transporter substrate-binding protein, partial [Euryarchaeota archaeon]|nr:ABC transporter substrate-binding protein [Euryarchaeota archaeon]